MKSALPPHKRIIITFATFVLIICAIVFVGIRQAKNQSALSKTQSKIGKKSDRDDNNKFFYKSIGKAPKSFVKSARPDKEGKKSYTLEIKVTSSRKEAEKVIDMLAKIGVYAYFTPVSRKGQVIYRIRNGMFANKKIAKNAAKILRSEKKIDARVRQLL